jgi:uncharacterized membrane protein
MRARTRERVGQEVADWRHAGLIDANLATLLERRYDVGLGMRQVLLRWLGVLALLLLGGSLLGALGMALGPLVEQIAPVLIAVIAGVLWHFGVRLAIAPEQRHATSGSVLITGSLVAAFGAAVLGLELLADVRSDDALPFLLGGAAALAVATSYRHGLRWPLTLGVLLGFHALGSSHGYVGRGGYLLGIADERLMFLAGAAVAVLGLWHERRVENDASRHLGFGRIYLTLGALYANASLWLLSIDPGGLAWVLAFTALGIAQLVAGAALRDGRITGFGVVFLAIDLYTRAFEQFWDDVSRAVFFLVGGLIAIALAAAFELTHRRRVAS